MLMCLCYESFIISIMNLLIATKRYISKIAKVVKYACS